MNFVKPGSVCTGVLICMSTGWLGCNNGSTTIPGSNSDDVIEFVGDTLGLNVSRLEVLFEKNTYSDLALPLPGGQSDGEILVALRVDSAASTEFAALCSQSKAWKRLPFSSEIVNGESFLIPSWPNAFAPYEAKSGFYFFIDRYDNDQHSDKEFHDRWSQNITVAVYDEELGILYFHLLDT